MAERLALYFGSLGDGHFLHAPNRRLIYYKLRDDFPDFPWTYELLDTRLLKNGQVPESPDGRVH